MKIKNPTLRLAENDSQEGQITWRSPSNIAIVKYWGKYGIQLPRNPNISFTLNNAYTETVLTYETKEKKDDAISLEFYFEGQENEAFRLKQVKFLSTLLEIFPFLTQLHLKIESHNSFPHSAGIASSASSMSALALCLCSLENQLFHNKIVEYRASNVESLSKPDTRNPSTYLKKASYLARLGSGSACRSVYPIMAQWGKMKGVKDSSNEYAIPFESEIHEIFKTYHDDILIISKGEKSVSSRMGHGLMDNNPYAKPRYAQANSRMVTLLEALKAGDVETFGQIAEDEALTLHALMMTSSPSFTLLKPNTLKLIEILRGYREASKTPVFFSLDAGPNLHLLYPHAFENQVKGLIDNELKQYCENGQVIFDTVGQGAVSI
jgi:diphosphomevalonate decarboxylase